MEFRKFSHILCKKIRNHFSKVTFLIRRRLRSRFLIKRLRKKFLRFRKFEVDFSGRSQVISRVKPIRVASFNAALFAAAPVVPNTEFSFESIAYGLSNSPKSILKTSPLCSTSITHERNTKSPLRVSINLPENEISLSNSRRLTSWIPVRSPLFFPLGAGTCDRDGIRVGPQTVFDVLKDVNADIFALQDVKAEEERGMQPLSSLADALGMNYVFAESWAPEYGNAILSKWPIKKWTVEKILEDDDIRNVLKATIDVPCSGEIDVYCTQLDNLDENWRMKQIKAIIQSSERPHVLAGGLNSLERSDYASTRWIDIIKYFEDIGKPKPKDEVMKLLKARGYEDAVDYAGECEPVVIATKGQNVQGTCKYGTRVDYILTSPNMNYNFIPGSYSVISSKGTSDHHVVKVDIIKCHSTSSKNKIITSYFRSKEKVVRLGSPSSRGLWSLER
ncbi:hypothetical protein RND81_14G071900 [Saponaria officinalis]|uniref:Endonuclease/exonuclease/phosphatase domain-containing protein n=1 Tax=Saponaria officinalis TaxID=3572 RepID=A0AAW1GJG4_SAPOF